MHRFALAELGAASDVAMGSKRKNRGLVPKMLVEGDRFAAETLIAAERVPAWLTR